MTVKTDIPALRLQVLDALNDALTNRVAYHIPDVQIVPTIDLLNLLPRFLDELQAMRAKWEFEHELAMDQEAEINRLDEEISVLQEQLKASRESVAQFCRMLGVDTDVEAWNELASLLRLVNFMPEAPAYIVPAADPLLAKTEKHR